MTLEELAKTLPCGFHDAEIIAVNIDYAKGEVLLRVNFWAPDADDRDVETYRLANVLLSGLHYWVVEPPDLQSHWDGAGDLTIDLSAIDTLKHKDILNLPPTPKGAFANCFYVNEWNAFIYVCADQAALQWLGEKTVRR